MIVRAEKWVNGLFCPLCRRPTARRTAKAARASWLISACAALSYSGAGGQPGALALLPLRGLSDRARSQESDGKMVRTTMLIRTDVKGLGKLANVGTTTIYKELRLGFATYRSGARTY